MSTGFTWFSGFFCLTICQLEPTSVSTHTPFLDPWDRSRFQLDAPVSASFEVSFSRSDQRYSKKELGSSSEVYIFRVDFRAGLFIIPEPVPEATMVDWGFKPVWRPKAFSWCKQGVEFSCNSGKWPVWPSPFLNGSWIDRKGSWNTPRSRESSRSAIPWKNGVETGKVVCKKP